MSGRYLLDTNAVIALIDGERSMHNLVAQADEVFIPSPVLGKLYFGAFRSRQVRDDIARIDDLVRWYAILYVDATTAKTYGNLRHQLSDAGHPIPDNDVWIAAVVQQYGATLATRDAHFDAVENLVVVRW